MRLPTLAACLFMMTGCSTYRFTKLDPAFVATPRNASPMVCIEQPPPAFRAVGLIELDRPQDIDAETLRIDAEEAGQKVGCEIVVSTTLTSASLLKAGVVLVHEGHDTSDKASSQSGRVPSEGKTQRDMVPMKTFRFHCGLLAGPHDA